MKFELDKDQKNRLHNWQTEIKKRFGKYGLFDFIFTPNGIGIGIKIKSHLTGEVLDLSDVEKW